MYFFYSGYGNYLSLNKTADKKEVARKTSLHIFRLIVIFFVSFVGVVSIQFIFAQIFSLDVIAFDTLVESVLTLCMVGTSTWYLKVQILFYFIAAIAFIVVPSKYRNGSIVMMTLLYVLVARGCGLSDYWWKTAMCFPMGTIYAENKDVFQRGILKYKWSIVSVLVVLMGCAYIWILKDGLYRVIPQLLAYIIFSIAIPVGGSVFQLKNKQIAFIGKASLQIYLIHIGLAACVFQELYNANLQIAVFIVLTIILSIAAYYVDIKIRSGISSSKKCKSA